MQPIGTLFLMSTVLIHCTNSLMLGLWWLLHISKHYSEISCQSMGPEEDNILVIETQELKIKSLDMKKTIQRKEMTGKT